MRGMAELETASAPPAASAALSDALRDLRAGLAQAQALAAEVAAAEAEDAAADATAAENWLGALLLEPPAAGGGAKDAAFAAELAALREELTSRVTGSSTFTLDAAGLVVSHVDALDFDAALSSTALAAQLEAQAAAGAAPSGPEAARAAAQLDRAARASANHADAIFQLCLAHRLPERGAWSWRFDVVRQLLWEAFLRDDSTDDEARARAAPAAPAAPPVPQRGRG